MPAYLVSVTIDGMTYWPRADMPPPLWPDCLVQALNQVHSEENQNKMSGSPMQVDGAVKDDAGKARWDLLPYDAVTEVVDVFTYGAKKYGDRNWEKGINNGRLLAAAMRHIVARVEGAQTDAESGQYHLAHAAANLLMWLHNDLRGQ